METIDVGSLNDLHSVIDKLQWVPNKFVIRGKLIAGTPTQGIRRLLRPDGDVPASFEPAARHWVMLDIDDVTLPETLSDVDAKAEAIIAHSVFLLPEPFRSAACVFQWSGSMGFKKDKIRVHLWFWLDRALSDDDLKAWLQDSPVDLALFNPVQVHYTANPILDLGVGDDPIRKRVGLYAPVGSLEEVSVPADLPAPKNPSSTRPHHHVSIANIVDPQGITRDTTTGLVIDGRERFMFFKSIDATKELMVGRAKAGDFPTVKQIADQTWKLFRAEADLSDGKWTHGHAIKDAERRYKELEDDTYSFVSRADSTMLEPCSEPFVKLDLVTKEQGQKRLADALETFFANTDEGPRLALRITMGAGKTRATIKKLQAHLAGKAGQSIEIYVPRHDLAEQYVEDIQHLDGEFCAEVIHMLPRVSADPEAYPDMCKRPDYARSLNSMGLGVFHNACRSNDGVRCEHYDSCPYIRQFKMPTPREGTRGNCVRVLSHLYLGLPRNPVQTDPDLVIIDEAFLDVLIDTKTEIAPADIKKYIKTDKHSKLGKWIVESLEDREPLLNVLRDKGVTCAHLTGIDLDQLRPHVAFNPKANRPVANTGNGALHRSLSLLLKVLKEELALVPARDTVERLVHDPAKNLIRVAYLKEVDLPETTPILCLDATADKTLLEEVLGSVKVEQISVEQNAVVAQVYDRTGSKTFWEGNTAPVDELLEVANAWAKFGEKPLIVGNLGLAEKLRDHKSRHDDVAVMHFGALRGSNAAEDCSIIFLTARNQPPMVEIDLKARALFWSAREQLQHDEGAQFKEKDNYDIKPVKRLRGFVQSSRNTHRQSGVRVTSFSDDRIDALLSQSRDAETMQALGRLRLVHAVYQKRVFLLSNLPVEMPVDTYVEFSDLMPDRLEFELIKHGNIPLTPLGLAKIRPDLATSTANAEKLLQRSKVRTTSRLKAIPELVRCSMFIIEFKAKNAGRWNAHQHLFIVSDQVGERQADAPNVMLNVGSVPLQDWVQILEKAWGAIRKPHLSFA